MSKGMVEILAFIVVLGIILLIEYFVVSYFVRFDFVVGRFMSEVPLLSEGDKIETYARSFQSAVELSLLQGIYDKKDWSQELWYDYPNSNIPTEDMIKESITTATKLHVEEYLTDYSEFAKNNGKIDVPNPNIRPDTINSGNLNWDDSSVSIEFNEIEFKREKDGLIFDRIFKPSGRVRTEFKTVWDLTNDLISNDKIGIQVRDKVNSDINTEDKCNDTNDVKNKINTAVEGYKTVFNSDNADKNVQITLTIENYDVSPIYVSGNFDHCQVRITVKVIMEVKDETDDKKYKYPVFDGSGVIEDYLGLIYRIRTGN